MSQLCLGADLWLVDLGEVARHLRLSGLNVILTLWHLALWKHGMGFCSLCSVLDGFPVPVLQAGLPYIRTGNPKEDFFPSMPASSMPPDLSLFGNPPSHRLTPEMSDFLGGWHGWCVCGWAVNTSLQEKIRGESSPDTEGNSQPSETLGGRSCEPLLLRQRQPSSQT